MTSENAGPFENALRAHDWYYMYSDDHRYWVRGQRTLAELEVMHSELACPFELFELNDWVHEMIFEQFEEREPDKFWRKGQTRKLIAPASRSDLITQARVEEIEKWMLEHDRPENRSTA